MDRKKFIKILLAVNAVLLCGIFILIAGVFRDIPENVTESVEHVLDRDVELTDRENGLYTYQTAVSVPIEGTISFQARDDEGIRTNYAQQAFRYIADAYFQEGEISWEETEAWGLPAWRLAVNYAVQEGQSMMDFCGYMGEFAELCMKSDAFMRNGHMVNPFPAVSIQPVNGRRVLEFSYNSYGYPGYTQEDFEQELYIFLNASLADGSGEETGVQGQEAPLSGGQAEEAASGMEGEHSDRQEERGSYVGENLDRYLGMEADAVLKLENGREYRLIATDYTMGSNYYILLGVEAGGTDCFLFNPDPFNQGGGQAEWIWFLDDTTGFICKSGRGRETGQLYRTEDGGESFENVSWPEIERPLEDGSPYAPYKLPEAIYEEDGKLYLIVNQGSMKSFHNQEGIYPRAVFVSEDQGESWELAEEIE